MHLRVSFHLLDSSLVILEPLASGSLSSVRTRNIPRSVWIILTGGFFFETGNQAKIQSAFKAAFQKLAVLGQDTSKMVDCSELIPVPPQLKIATAHFPAGLTNADVEQAVSISPQVVFFSGLFF
jgi:hypothetical protein